MKVLFKCYKCNELFTLDRTIDPDNKTTVPYQQKEPCPKCHLPMNRIYIDPLDVTELEVSK
jgi:hypothetical protein